MLWFDALFSRPFHRIENSVWMALAFALANRSIFARPGKLAAIDSDFVYRCFGGLIAGVALYGFVFLAGGVMGDKIIYKTIAEQSGAQEKYDQLHRAAGYLMSRDDAREQIAQLEIQVGRLQNNPDIFARGLEGLYRSFYRRPTSKLLIDVVGYAKQLGDPELLRDMSRFLNPGMFGIGADGRVLSE
jgi:hypothetical protein